MAHRFSLNFGPWPPGHPDHRFNLRPGNGTTERERTIFRRIAHEGALIRSHLYQGTARKGQRGGAAAGVGVEVGRGGKSQRIRMGAAGGHLAEKLSEGTDPVLPSVHHDSAARRGKVGAPVEPAATVLFGVFALLIFVHNPVGHAPEDANQA